METVAARLDDFVEAQKLTLMLPKNLSKSDWRDQAEDEILAHLLEELEELIAAMAAGTTEEIKSEACDVANFAFMLWDWFASLESGEGERT